MDSTDSPISKLLETIWVFDDPVFSACQLDSIRGFSVVGFDLGAIVVFLILLTMAKSLPQNTVKMYSELGDRDKKHMGLRFRERYNHVTNDRFQAIATGKAKDLTLDEYEFTQSLIQRFYSFSKT